MYVICNENNEYVFHSIETGYQIVDDIHKACKWKNRDKAKNMLEHNCIYEKVLKSFTWRIVPVDSKDKPITVDTTVSDSSKAYCNIEEKIDEIYTFTKHLEERKLYFADELRNADAEITDIEHAAEFYNLSASQGYKIYKLLHNARIKRRAIKDELQIIGLTLGTHIKSDELRGLKLSIQGLDTRQYTPRINKELFNV